MMADESVSRFAITGLRFVCQTAVGGFGNSETARRAFLDLGQGLAVAENYTNCQNRHEANAGCQNKGVLMHHLLFG